MTIILVLAIIAIAFLWYRERNDLKLQIAQLNYRWNASNADLVTEKAKNANIETEISSLRIKILTVELKNAELSKYQHIIDVENTAKEIEQAAQREAQNIKEKAYSILSNASNEAQQTIQNANEKAEQIAGNALRAVKDAESATQTAKAMKNIIDGYGSQYLIPTYSLLDELAEEFGHIEAGKELTRIREQIRNMVKNSTAATCDYVENNRKEIAINFVVDAFNGKVDSILSSVKKDNYGILEQKIKDAFYTVNFNGNAFRSAAITKEYLDLRISELKFAVILQELKFQEKEEQRIIKERMREEEKARREYEKAIKDAEKEEEAIKKAIEKAQKEMSQASEAQREKYEEKLRELQGKLEVAEDKNKRAMSMAQQTRAGNVYIISNIGSFGENVFKIGMTRRLEPMDRVKELGDASVPFEFDVHSLIYSDDAPTLEKQLHKTFIAMQVNKVNPKKEFFKVPLLAIRQELEKLGLDAKFTMNAEAKEYRETLELEKSLANDETKKAIWLNSQLAMNEKEDVEKEEIES